jgi:hypothetical protein
VLSQLYDAGLDPATSRSLDFCFYTNTDAKAKGLIDELKKLGYAATYTISYSDGDSLATIIGNTNPVPMDEKSILHWTENMCVLGYDYDSKFDGWGAPVQLPDQ